MENNASQDQTMTDNQLYSQILKEQLIKEKNGNNLNYTEKRILKDLEEFETNVNPEMGISAKPLKDTIYTWHANIRGLPDTPYDGGIFHFEITIPGDYPNKPPVITTKTPMTNNFFVGNKYRSEMVEDEWCSGFSLFSLLLQIQFGFFDNQVSQHNNIKQEVTGAKTYKCNSCDHNGEANIYPPFESALENGPISYASKSEEEKIVEDTFCFHTRNNVKETTLGTGVAFARQMRTTQVDRIYTTIDLVSQKAFKEGLRKSVNKKRFSHWLPLYFDETCDKAKTVDLFRKHISDIAAGSKDKFDEDMILKTMPKLLLTHSMQLLNDKAYSSILGLRMLNYFHRAFIFMLDHHPQVQNQLEKDVEQFIHDEGFRNKDNTPDLGVIPAMVCASRKFTFQNIVKVLIEEKLARHVFFVLKENPEFENINDEIFNAEFAKKVFKATEGGWRLVMFIAFYNNYIIDKNQEIRNLDLIVEEYDKRFSRLYYKIEDVLQEEVSKIKNVDNFNDFFARIGLPTMTDNELKEMMINSVVKSKEKGYHGGFDVYYPLPDIKQQAKIILQDKVTAMSFYNPFDEEEKVMDDEEDFLKYIKQRFSWTRHFFLLSDQDTTPEQLALASDIINIKNKHIDGLHDNYQYKEHDEIKNKISEASAYRIYEGYTWKDVFMKLDLEDYIKHNEYVQDNETLKNYLDACSPHISGLVIRQPMRQSDDISYSAYTNIIKACAPTLKKLVILGSSQVYEITQGFLQCIRIGLKSAENIDLKELELHYVNYGEGKDEPIAVDQWEKIGFVGLIKVIPKIETLRISSITVAPITLQSIFSEINLENLKEISLVNCSVDKYTAKELGKLLKGASCLEVFNISHNKIEHGIKDIFKSLAGKPQLRIFDISYNFLTHVQGISKCFENFIVGTPNIQYINFDFTNIHENLSSEALESIGELKNLRGISFSSSTCKMSTERLKSVAQAIANSKNKESKLESVVLRGCFNSYGDYEEFFEILSQISPIKEFENLEGFELIDDPMGGFKDGILKYLDISLGTFNSGFEQHKLKKDEILGLTHVFAIVDSLNMDSCKMTEKDMRMIKYCMKKVDTHASIKRICLSNNNIGAKGAAALSDLPFQEIDLSNCKLGVGGAVALSKGLKQNDILKRLYLFCNSIKVEGCRSIGQSLEENKTLEVLDLGSNIIRNKGFNALSSVFNTGVKLLAVKNNKIGDKSFVEVFQKYLDSGNKELKSLLINSNEVSMYTIKKANEVLEDKSLHLDVTLKLENHNDRTLFLCGINQQNKIPHLKKYFDSKGCGLIENIEVLKGKEKKKGKKNIFGFVKFAHKNGKMRVVKMLKDVEEKPIKV